MTETPNKDPFTLFVNALPAANPAALATGFRTSAALGERLSRVALHAADDAAELSGAWTKVALADLGVALRSREAPSDYASALSAFAAASMEVATEKLAGFAEVAKRVHMETIEVLLDPALTAPAEPAAAEPAPVAETAKVADPVVAVVKPAAMAETAAPRPAPKAPRKPRVKAVKAAPTAAGPAAARPAPAKPAAAKPATRRTRQPSAPKLPPEPKV